MPESQEQKSLSSKGTHQIIRPLGHNERYQLARYTLDQYRGTSVSCRYPIPKVFSDKSQHNNLTHTVNAAVGQVVSTSPTLQVGISGHEGRHPVWINLGRVDLNEHITWVQLDDTLDIERTLQEYIRSEIDSRFFELDSRPGWKVVVLQHHNMKALDILFIWNHPHGDGMSGKIFHELLLERLNTLTTEVPQQRLDDLSLEFPDSSAKFPPSTEDLVKMPVSPSLLLKAAWDDNKPTSFFKSPTQADWASIRTSPYKSLFKALTIEDSILSKVLVACRQHESTITSLLHALALVSLSSYLDDSRASAFASSTAIDQRRFLPTNHPDYPWFEPKRTIANYVSIMTHKFERSIVAEIRSRDAHKGNLSDELLNLIWSVSKNVRMEIKDRLHMGLENDSVGLMKYVPDWKAQFRSDVKKPRKLSWFVTNLGVMEGKPAAQSEETWSIHRAQFALSTETPVAALLIAAMTVKSKDMVITCTWQDAVVEASLVECLMADMKRWLTQIGSLS